MNFALSFYKIFINRDSRSIFLMKLNARLVRNTVVVSRKFAMKSIALVAILLILVFVLIANTEGCIPNEEICQWDGSIGNCCSGYCYQQIGWARGKCRNR